MDEYLQSTARRVPLKAYLASDHVTAATSKTLAVQISKNGAVFGNPAAGATNATEVGSGWYYVDLGTADTDTLGPVLVRATEATVDDVEIVAQVVPATNRGATNLDAAVSSRSTYSGADTAGTTTLLSRIPGVVQPQTGDSYARLGSPAGASVIADLGTATAATQSIVLAVKAKTDNLPADPASTTEVNTRLAAADYTAPPTDYQQRDVAVTLPTTPPEGYGGGDVDVGAALTSYGAAKTSDLPTDYQQRGVAVTLPAEAPTGYGGTGATAAEVWEYADRTLSAFGFEVTAEVDTAAIVAALAAYTPTWRDVSAVTSPTVADCWCAAYAATAGGMSDPEGTSLTVYQPDGKSVFRAFAVTVDDDGDPLTRE